MFTSGLTAEVLTMVIGFWAIFGGSVELAGAFTGRSGWLAMAGLLTVAVGIVLIAAPAIGAVSLALIFGIYLLSCGITLLVSAARAKGRPSFDSNLRGRSAAAEQKLVLDHRWRRPPPAARGRRAAPA